MYAKVYAVRENMENIENLEKLGRNKKMLRKSRENSFAANLSCLNFEMFPDLQEKSTLCQEKSGNCLKNVLYTPCVPILTGPCHF